MAAVLAVSQRAQAQATSMSAAFDQVGPSLLKAGAALTALAAGFALLVKSGSDLQQELVHVAGNTSMSAAEFDNLQSSVVRLGLTVPVAMGDIGKSYMQAANFGFHFAEANAVVEAALKSATATGANAEQTTRALAIAMHQFNIPAAQAAQTMDVLHLAAARGGQTLEQFTAVTGRAFAVARAMGISLVDVSAALSALTSSGLSAAQSATLLQGAIVKIANPAVGARNEIAQLSKATGVDLVSDFSKAGLSAKGLSGVMDDIAKAVGNNTAEILKLVPAMRGGIGVILLTTTAAVDYKNRLQELNDVMAGKLKPTQQDFERVMKTLGAQTGILANSFQALGFELVKALGPSLVGAIETLNGIVPKVVLFIGQLPPVIIAATAAFFGAVGVVGSVSVALGGLVFLLGGPVTAAIAGLGIAIGALAAIVALNFGRISSIVSAGSGTVNVSFVSIAAKAGAVADAFQVLARVAVSMFDIIVTGAILMAQGVKQAFNTIADAGTAALALARNDMVGFASAMGSMAGTTLDSGKTISETLKGLLGRVSGDLKDIASHASGQFAKSFALAASDAGRSFAKASAEQHQLMEEAGLKLVNAYLTGVVKGKPMSAATWHAMSDEARASFTQTAQSWVQSSTQMLDAAEETAKKKGKKVNDALEKALKAQLDLVNDWLKAIDSKTQISDAVWDKLLAPDTKTALLKASTAFHVVQDTIQKGQAEALAATVTAMAGHRQVIDVSIGDWSAWGDKIRAVTERLGVDIKIVGHVITEEMGRIGERSNFSAQAVEQWSEAWVDGLGKAFQVVQRLVPSLHPALDALREAVKNLKEDIASSPLFQELKMKDEASRAFESVIQIVQREGERLGLTQDQTNRMVLDRLTQFGAEMKAKYGLSADEAVAAFKRSMDKLPGALDEIFNKLALGAKHQVAGLVQVIDSIPGKFGDAFRQSTNEVIKWINQIDGLLKGLQGIFGQAQTGLAGVLQSVIGIFKGTAGAASQATTHIGSVWDNVGKVVGGSVGGLGKTATTTAKTFKAGFAAMEGAMASFAASAAVTIGTGSKTMGFLTSLVSATGAGIAAGLAFGPVGGAIVGGISLLGGILGMFAGKSPLQKAQEAAALQKAKDDIKLSQQAVEQAFEATKQSILETADKARQLLEAITFYTRVPKDAFKAFFEDLDKLMKAFAEHAKNWMTDASGKIKVFAEDVKVVTETIGGAVLALTALGPYPGVAEKYITRFGDDLALLIEKISAVGDAFTRKGLRTARKFAEQIGEVVTVIADAILAFAGTKDTPGLAQYQRIPIEVFDLFAADLQLAVQKMAEIAGQIDNGLLKQANFFAEKTQAVVDVIAGAMTAFLGGPDSPGLVKFVSIPSEVLDAFFTAFLAVTNRMAGLVNSVDTSMLAQAEMVAQKSMAVFAAIKAAVESLTALAAFKGVPDEAYQNVLADFKRGVVMISLLLLDATEFEDKAKKFESIVLSGMQHFSAGISAYVGGWTSAAQALTAMPSGGSSLTPGPGFGSVGGMSTQSMTTQSHTTYINIGDLNIPAGSVAGELIKKLADELQRIATGGVAREPLLA